MPSGAKKRKAAKKKKVLGSQINPSSNSSHGNDDVKSQDDKGSDSGENNQNVGLGSESKNGTVQIESVEGSCASSSDDESVDTTKKPEVLDVKTNDLVAPAAGSIVYAVTPVSEEGVVVVESASVENTSIPDIIASEKLEARLPASDEVTNVPVTAPTDLSVKQNEDRDLHLSAHIKDSESPETPKPESEDQPLIGSRPPVPQRTSWWSCCGLCDVFTGSDR